MSWLLNQKSTQGLLFQMHDASVGRYHWVGRSTGDWKLCFDI